MFSYIYGKVTEQSFNSITIDVNNVGYLVYVSNPYYYKLDEDYRVYLYQYVREDENTLYGFANTEEKDIFLKLLSVKGIGPKMALPMLSTGNINNIISAIEREDICYLKKFPKVGEKVAKQIILDLKGKLVSNDSNIKINEELKNVLIGLGYKEKEIRNVISSVDNSLSLEQQIKEALKLLLK